jgi:hypothetical protein
VGPRQIDAVKQRRIEDVERTTADKDLGVVKAFFNWCIDRGMAATNPVYVQEHSRVLPHSAFRGQTPDEMYFGTGDTVPADLTSRAAAARRARVEANRSAACTTCPSVDAAA